MPSSSTSLCIDSIDVHNTQIVVTVAILGSAGYTGQETIDRVLNHPGLELVALGSDSLAGRPAQALDPRLNGSAPMFTANAEAAAAGAEVIFLCLGNEQAAAFEPPLGGGRDRPRRGAPAERRLARPPLVRRQPRRLELRAARGSPGDRPADREPRLLRDGGPAGALAPARGERRRRRHRREVGHDRGGQDPAGTLARRLGPRELRPVRPRRAPPWTRRSPRCSA